MNKIFSLTLLALCSPMALAVEVTSLEDSGQGSLRQAIIDAPATSTITFAQALSGNTITLSTGQIMIEKALVIDASGLGEGITITANGNSRLFEITAAVGEPGVTFDSLTFTGGKSEDGEDNPLARGGDAEDGGAISNAGVLVIRNSTLSNNLTGRGGLGASDDVGGAGLGGSGGAIFNDGTLTLIQSKLLDNRAGDGGDGVGEFGISDDGGDGGAIYNQGSLSIDRCVLSGNAGGRSGDSDSGGGNDGGDGGAIYNAGSATITSSTISCNISGASSVDPDAEFALGSSGVGGGIFNSRSATLIIKRSTLVGNTVGDDPEREGRGGAIGSFGGTVELQHCTIVGNGASGQGAAIFSFSDSSVLLSDCIVTDNLVGGVEGNFGTFGSVISLSGLNIITEHADSGIDDEDSALLVALPLLAPLGDYGGPTPTMPPAPSSPAIDRASSGVTGSDQRGFPASGALDIGAVEFQGTMDLVRFFPIDFDRDGLPYGVEKALGVDPFVPDLQSSALPVFSRTSAGVVSYSFGIGSDALQGTRWIITRGTDLKFAGRNLPLRRDIGYCYHWYRGNPR